MKIEIELNKIIQSNNEVINVVDVMVIVSYKLRNEKFRDGIKKSDLFCFNFVFVLVKENQILDMFGKF